MSVAIYEWIASKSYAFLAMTEKTLRFKKTDARTMAGMTLILNRRGLLKELSALFAFNIDCVCRVAGLNGCLGGGKTCDWHAVW